MRRTLLRILNISVWHFYRGFDNLFYYIEQLFIPCGGADDPRPIKLRLRPSDGKWFLWEQYLLTGVRTPKSADPWA